MFKHAISHTLLTLGAIAILTSTGVASDIVAFSKRLMPQAQSLGGITVFAKLDQYAVALVEPAKYSELSRLDPSTKIIESPGSLEFLYLADKGLPGGKILFETEHRLLLKLTPAGAESLMAVGARLVKCFEYSLPG